MREPLLCIVDSSSSLYHLPTMPPEVDHSDSDAEGKQTLFIVRHGDRWDYANPEWSKTSTRKGDPPLSALGHQQARETGQFLDAWLAEEGLDADNITWLSSPFLRTIQTSNEAINAFTKTKGANRLEILPEYSVFEWDGKNGEWHASLPPLSERVHYFPRVNATYKSLFVPEIPEPRAKFHDRCERAVSALNNRFPFSPRSVIVVVSHAAACIGLSRAAANLTLQDINPAAPCSIYKLSRTSDTHVWDLDPHDMEGGMNGFTDHLSSLGESTVPWNHFGDKKVNKGYTGPPTSRFAPNDEL